MELLVGTTAMETMEATEAEEVMEEEEEGTEAEGMEAEVTRTSWCCCGPRPAAATRAASARSPTSWTSTTRRWCCLYLHISTHIYADIN